LNSAQIECAAIDAIAGSCIDYKLASIAEPLIYSKDSTPLEGSDVCYVVGTNAPNEPCVIGLRGVVVGLDTAVVSGPHAKDKGRLEYKPGTNARRRLTKVRVTDVTTRSLVNLPHPRLSVCCSSLLIGDVLWLPHKQLRPWENKFMLGMSSNSESVTTPQAGSEYVQDNADDTSSDSDEDFVPGS
jgi:hypothetical protein